MNWSKKAALTNNAIRLAWQVRKAGTHLHLVSSNAQHHVMKIQLGADTRHTDERGRLP